tara:strand:+ start:1645 stop:2286 length:642 start_codon:yes stop_codon:yes gene_type:complete
MTVSEIEHLITEISRDVHDPKVIEVLRTVPRDRFVRQEARCWAWKNHALAIGYGQTISQPVIVALMTEAAAIKSTDHVLEIGTGSGYQAAVAAMLAKTVTTVEVIDELRRKATKLLDELGIDNVQVKPAGTEIGAPNGESYDVILITAAVPEIPPPLFEQLTEGGRIVAPVGNRNEQELIVGTKLSTRFESRSLGRCLFVPLHGQHGFENRSS